MTGPYHEPVVQRKFLLVLKVLETVIPDLDSGEWPLPLSCLSVIAKTGVLICYINHVHISACPKVKVLVP